MAGVPLWSRKGERKWGQKGDEARKNKRGRKESH